MKHKAIAPGDVFGRLTTVSKVVEKLRYARWYCKCICGTIKIVRARDLKTKNTESCGCFRTELRRKGTQTSFSAKYASYKYGAATKGVPFLLSKTTFKKIVMQNCHYCGSVGGKYSTYLNHRGELNRKALKDNIAIEHIENTCVNINGIDRKNNNKGYTTENSLPCCKICNFAKRDMPYAEFISYIGKLISHRKKHD